MSVGQYSVLCLFRGQYASYLVILTNDYIVSVEEIWDVLLDHIIP